MSGLSDTTENHPGSTVDVQAGATVHNLVQPGSTTNSVIGFFNRQNKKYYTLITDHIDQRLQRICSLGVIFFPEIAIYENHL